MLLGLDLGTGSLKAILLDENAQIVAQATRAYSVYSPQPGWAESNPNDWWTAACAATLELGHGDEITAIGFSGQMHGVVLSDAKGQALRNAILWADTRSSLELEQYKNLEPTSLRRLANPLVTGMAGASLLWLKHFEPKLLKTARWASFTHRRRRPDKLQVERGKSARFRGADAIRLSVRAARPVR